MPFSSDCIVPRWRDRLVAVGGRAFSYRDSMQATPERRDPVSSQATHDAPNDPARDAFDRKRSPRPAGRTATGAEADSVNQEIAARFCKSKSASLKTQSRTRSAVFCRRRGSSNRYVHAANSPNMACSDSKLTPAERIFNATLLDAARIASVLASRVRSPKSANSLDRRCKLVARRRDLFTGTWEDISVWDSSTMVKRAAKWTDRKFQFAPNDLRQKEPHSGARELKNA